MAWQTSTGKHQYRKEASSSRRSETERAAIVEPVTSHRRKAVPNYKKKFGIEKRYIGEDQPGLRFLRRREWHMNYGGWYEKERDRDNAIEGLRKGSSGWGGHIIYEYRAIDR